MRASLFHTLTSEAPWAPPWMPKAQEALVSGHASLFSRPGGCQRVGRCVLAWTVGESPWIVAASAATGPASIAQESSRKVLADARPCVTQGGLGRPGAWKFPDAQPLVLSLKPSQQGLRVSPERPLEGVLPRALPRRPCSFLLQTWWGAGRPWGPQCQQTPRPASLSPARSKLLNSDPRLRPCLRGDGFGESNPLRVMMREPSGQRPF